MSLEVAKSESRLLDQSVPSLVKRRSSCWLKPQAPSLGASLPRQLGDGASIGDLTKSLVVLIYQAGGREQS